MAEYRKLDAKTAQDLSDIANKLRIGSIKATSASNSGHPTSCSSAAECMAVLFFHTMRYRVDEPKAPENDRFILSKGHACPVLYAAWAHAGLFPDSDLLNLRKIDNDLEGHPTPRLNFIDVATGSLGQGLGISAGMAYTGKYIDKTDYRTYCMIGDGEQAEGGVWEAMSFCSHYKLDNIVAIFDINRLGQSEPAALQHDMDQYRARCEGFGWNTLVVDGHSVEDLAKAFHEACTVKDKPTAVLMKTYKGRGFPGIEDQDNWHGKPLGAKAEEVIATLQKAMKNQDPKVPIAKPVGTAPAVSLTDIKLAEPLPYKLGQKVATRGAYGDALVRIGKSNPRVIAMDGDTKNSTFSIKYKNAFPDRFVECFIAEQNLVGVGIGVACRDRAVVFVSTFAAFLSRAFDNIRMGALSQTKLNLCGSHCGISIGEDGPSQMALEDIAMFRAVPNAVIFYPSDAVSTERAVELAANTPSMCFIRTSRPNVPVMYENDAVFEIGKAKIVRQSSSDQVTIVGSCVTLIEALKAADELEAGGVNVRVVDPFTIKPLDVECLKLCAKATGGRVLTVEDHYAEGGIGDAVASALSMERNVIVKKLAVTALPRSGKPEQLLEMFGISANHIVKAVNQLLSA